MPPPPPLALVKRNIFPLYQNRNKMLLVHLSKTVGWLANSVDPEFFNWNFSVFGDEIFYIYLNRHVFVMTAYSWVKQILILIQSLNKFWEKKDPSKATSTLKKVKIAVSVYIALQITLVHEESRLNRDFVLSSVLCFQGSLYRFYLLRYI